MLHIYFLGIVLTSPPKKWKFCHHLLTLKLFQTWMSFFALLNTKYDILKNVGNHTVSAAIDFNSIFHEGE